jgi:hypothetical protein
LRDGVELERVDAATSDAVEAAFAVADPVALGF